MLVTAIDRPYLPGLKTLHKSYKLNSPDLDFACIVYGDDELAKTVSDMGIQVLHNPDIGARIPTTDRYPVGNSAMWCRIMLPKWFDRDVVWLDADQVILKPLNALFDLEYSEPCACVPSVSVFSQVEGLKGMESVPGIYSGLMHFNRNSWNAQNVTEKCFELMETSSLKFKYVVQSVLSLVLAGNFKHLPDKWQQFGNRHHLPISNDAHVVHWHGHSRKPWTHTMANNHLWQEYA